MYGHLDGLLLAIRIVGASKLVVHQLVECDPSLVHSLVLSNGQVAS